MEVSGAGRLVRNLLGTGLIFIRFCTLAARELARVEAVDVSRRAGICRKQKTGSSADPWGTLISSPDFGYG